MNKKQLSATVKKWWIAVAILGVCITGVVTIRIGRNHGRVLQHYDEITSRLEGDLVTASRIGKGDWAGARSEVEMEIDQAIISLYMRGKESPLGQRGMSALSNAVEYRKRVPFTEALGGARRDPRVREMLESIVRER